ncbi:serine hydrolase domain-containing protein [Lysinibacillus fusiformis]
MMGVNWNIPASDRLSLNESFIKEAYRNITGIVIIRNGKLAYENYFQKNDSEQAQHVASVTKSVLSALIGIAIDKGFIKSVEQRVLDFFPEYRTDDDVKQKMNIRHLLTMTVPYPFQDWHEPLDILCQQDDWVEYILNSMGEGGAIGHFKYSSAGAHLLSAILTQSTGKTALAFANEYLFQPIGIKEIPNYPMTGYGFDDLFGKNVKGWVHDPNGLSTGGWGLTMTTRDMARIGSLYMNKGLWNHQRILSKAWIQESIAGNSHHYGYLWWLREEEDFFSYAAVGDGGNIICCIPSLNTVVAISSLFMVNAPDRWSFIKEHIIPALMQ